ncbi:MAG: peroxiredoxin [Clostridia bacterium]|nr:peroxiredoxin [Clostridia bacterium]
MTLVGQPAPDFRMPSTKDMAKLSQDVRLSDYRGKWLVLCFYPADFTFVCPTELRALSERIEDFHALDAEVLGISVDNVYCHRAWIETPEEKHGLGPIRFPLASDITKEVSRAYGVLNEQEGTARRGLFIIDPDGIVQYEVVTANNVGRSVDETLRVLEALQTGNLCPADWRPGEPVLTV